MDRTQSLVSATGTAVSQLTDKTAEDQRRAGAGRLPTQPKLRRKAPIADTLHELTAVQRLVEYFVVITSEPRWEDDDGEGNVLGGKNSRGARGEGRQRRGPSFRRPRVPSFRRRNRQTDSSSSTTLESSSKSDDSRASQQQRQRTEGNIHMPDAGEAQNHCFRPNITSRYPVADHEDNPFNPMILQFCYPSGDVIAPSKSYEMPRVHHFVLTNERGRKVYGTCLTIMEEYVPTGRHNPWSSHSMTQEDDSIDGVEVRRVDKRSRLYIPKVLCVLSTWPYLTAFREYLAQLYRLSTATNTMTCPIERYIVNLCCEIPAPPPGAYEVQVNILDSTIKIWSPPAKLPIAYTALPFQIVFECLDLDNVLKVWSAMVMERKILLISSQYSILTVCAEILCSLLFPLRWSHLYVPLLPRMLCPMLDAPVPYVCGIVRENWPYAQAHVSGDTIVVDLDRNNVKVGHLVAPMPPLPAKKWSKLTATLTETVGHVYWRARGLEGKYRTMMGKKPHKRNLDQLRQSQGTGWTEKLAGLDHAFNLAYTPDSPNLLNDTLPLDERTMWDRVQEAFLRFFVALFKDYRKHLNIPKSSSCKNVTGGTPQPSQKPSFDRIGFLAAQKAERAHFLVELCMTQQFDDFIQKRIYS